MVALVFWIECTCSSCTCCHLHKTSQFVSDVMLNWKNEIMNGNQGDYLTFVWTWRRSKQGLNFCRTFHQFIQQHDADAVHKRNPDVTLLKQAVWYELLGFEYQVAVQLCFQNFTHACLLAKCTTHLKPQPCENPPRSGLTVIPLDERPC